MRNEQCIASFATRVRLCVQRLAVYPVRLSGSAELGRQLPLIWFNTVDPRTKAQRYKTRMLTRSPGVRHHIGVAVGLRMHSGIQLSHGRISVSLSSFTGYTSC